MKKPLYYAIKAVKYAPTIVAVTSEKTDRWFGRDTRDNLGTHGLLRDISGRFATLEQAQAKKAEVAEAREHFRAEYGKLEHARRTLSTAESAVLEEICSGQRQRYAERLVVKVSLT